MDRIEFLEAVEYAKKELSSERVKAWQDIDDRFSNMLSISIGTQKAIEDAELQMQKLKQEKYQEAEDRLKAFIAAKYFGHLSSRQDILMLIEATDEEAEFEIVSSEKRTPRGVLMRTISKLTALL